MADRIHDALAELPEVKRAQAIRLRAGSRISLLRIRQNTRREKTGKNRAARTNDRADLVTSRMVTAPGI